MNPPKPMKNPCETCPKAVTCIRSENYKCPLFRLVFTQSWNETVAYLRRLLQKEEEACP